MAPFIYFVNLIQTQKSFWKSIARNQELSAPKSPARVSPLQLEISLCVKLINTFLVLCDQNLQLAIAENNPIRISLFAILNSIVLDNIGFTTSFHKIYRVYCFIETQKKVKNPSNLFELCVVEIVNAFHQLARATRETNMRPATSMSEAHANASSSLKLKKLFSTENFVNCSNEAAPLFRDFDLSLCSNTETSVLNSRASAQSMKKIRSTPNAKITFCGIQLLALSRTMDQLRAATTAWSFKRMIQARLWNSTIGVSLFSYGVERYLEKCSEESSRIDQINNELTRILLRLAEAGRQIKKLSLEPNVSVREIEEYSLSLARCALGYVVMAYWWWFQEAIGFDQMNKIRCFRKLDTPTREKFHVNCEKNEDIIAEYNRSLCGMNDVLSPKL